MSIRKAFTLIELLVVIAIIAILAAILFPVFSQAKESAKKVKNLSGIKQVATGAIMYSVDSDDMLPMALTYRYTNGTTNWNVLHPVPGDWKLASGDYWTLPAGWNQANQHWANSTQPYIKSWAIWDDTGFTRVENAADAADFAAPNRQPASVNFTYNGLLHTLSTSEVASPSRLTMFWNGFGKAAYRGRALSNPQIRCNNASAAYLPCRFNPTGVPQTGADGGYGWFWATDPASAFVFGEGMNFAHTDSSAKFRPIGRRTGPDTTSEPNRNYYGSPFAHIRNDGRPLTMWGCTISGATASYACFFRPDQDQFN
ncbi:MAG: prepilin-type N-terminal cleavage/methylation domain-containing protein [Fimbriimonadaceae bacterium]